MPELFYPGRKPVGNVKIDWGHPISAFLNDVLLLADGLVPPSNLVTGKQWNTDTTYGSTHYEYEPANGNMTLKRQDLDTSGITYSGETSTVNTDIEPFFSFIIYTILIAPTGQWECIMSRGESPHDAGPVWLLYSDSTTQLNFYANSSTMFSGIPVTVGKREFVLHRFDGDNRHDFYSSGKGVWETSAEGAAQTNINNRNYLGSGVNKELPCAFELFISGIGKAPSLAQCKDLIHDPYQFLIPA